MVWVVRHKVEVCFEMLSVVYGRGCGDFVAKFEFGIGFTVKVRMNMRSFQMKVYTFIVLFRMLLYSNARNSPGVRNSNPHIP